MIKKHRILLLFIIFINPIKSSNLDNINIVTSTGIVKGSIKNNVISWEDIPYALPPIDKLRWTAPRDFESNSIIKSNDNNSCVQESSNLGGVKGNEVIVGSEDCLYLDIKAPKNRKSLKSLPVMFWIHGGGNISGTKDIYDFSKMVKKHNVIVVTINYRLGPFGWMSHPAIQDIQSGLDKSSNYGTLDIIQALKWVKKNIHLFGGNKNNVTIFGESAGGHNVLSLIASPQAKGLFHKAISQSGYTTSISYQNAYNPSDPKYKDSNYSHKIVNNLINDIDNKSIEEVHHLLKKIPHDTFFKQYINKSSSDMPLLTNDGIVLPVIGLEAALEKENLINNVPVIAGSNRDEVKLWIGFAKYFVELDYSLIGSILGIPKIKIKNIDSFEAFNYYRSSAWQIRGVIQPLSALNTAKNFNTYAYRYDWDDHRKFLFIDLQKLIGAAHATEIPLITGNNKLVGNYGPLLYPHGPSKRFTSNNMMKFWTNFAKSGEPGFSTNDINWEKYDYQNRKFMILDKKRNMHVSNFSTNFIDLVLELNFDDRVNEIEKCVILYQISSLVGNNIFNELIHYADFMCTKSDAINFLEANDSFIEY
tara:strand:+ start:245 stop:2011 length:1767 start_codon:yes stop_codon:yes gene_type:complete